MSPEEETKAIIANMRCLRELAAQVGSSITDAPEIPREAMLLLKRRCADMVKCLGRVLRQPELIDETAFETPCVVVGKCHTITRHAILRYRQRTKAKDTVQDRLLMIHIRTLIANSFECVLKPQFLINEMLTHGGHARFWRIRDLMFVIRDGIVRTVHFATANRWVQKKI